MKYGDRHDIPKLWDEKFTKEIKKYYKISFCTTCMGRLYDLKKTLLLNIKASKSYPNLEFVILNYNSKDGLEEWVKKNMMEHIESERLIYYKTSEPKYFDMSHAKNIVNKLSSGEIVNNLDADNYAFDNRGINNKKIPKMSWAHYLNKIANEFPKKAIFIKSNRVPHGRIGFYKNEFVDVLGGYDENLEGYGYEDFDIVERAIALNFIFCPWRYYYSRIHTSSEQVNENLKKCHKITKIENLKKAAKNIAKKIFKVNQGKHWGKAKLIKNFKEEIEI